MTELTVRIPDNAGLEVLKQVDNLVEKLAAAESNLEHGYAKLGYLLTEVSENGYWRGQYESFGKYIALLGEKFSKGRTQLYNYFSTVRELKDHVSENQLAEMGISKASELRRAVKSSGVGPSQEIISEAVKAEVTVSDVRKLLFDAKQVGESETGEWLDLDMSGYVTADQKLLIKSALDAADRTDPIIQKDMKPSARNIERLTRFAMEYLNSHGDEENV